MTTPITLTPAAIEHIQSLIKKRGKGLGFRLAIKKTGCSGYAYQPQIADEIKSDDLHFMVENNLPVYIDPQALTLINGLTIDYVMDELMGLKQKRLVFINPNEKNRCGCGESFTL